jgi:hypothetical protein
VRLFRRNARLTIYRVRSAAFFDLLPNGIEITDLQMEFTITKKLGKAPDTCTIVITNLAETTRGELEKHPLNLHLDVGYDGEYRRIFTGDLRWGSSIKQGPDWKTTLQIADGARAFREAQVSKPFKAGTKVRTALTECARSMGLALPRDLAVSTELEEQFAAGITLDGAAHDELTRLLAPYGYEWTIQDGTLQAYKDDQARVGEALVISEANGMIETPVFAPPSESARKSKSVRRSTIRSPRLTIRNLLYPQIVPGVKLQVDSVTTRGIYKAIQVTHVGDTHGEDWTTTVEAKPL